MSTETGKILTIVGVLTTLVSLSMLESTLSYGPPCCEISPYSIALMVSIICNSTALRLFKRLNDPSAIYSNRIAFLSLMLCLLQIISLVVRDTALSLRG